MIKINVGLPLTVTQDDIDVLGRFSGTIKNYWVEYFCLTSNPQWERDVSVRDSAYFRLVTGEANPREVLCENIAALGDMKVEVFRARLYEASWSLGKKCAHDPLQQDA